MGKLAIAAYFAEHGPKKPNIWTHYRLSPKAERYLKLSDRCDANVISRKEAFELRLLKIELGI